MTDSQLIKAILRGEAKAQKALFEKHTPGLFQVSLRYSKNEMDAEDVLQDAWMKIFKGLSAYREEGKLFAWMKKIVVHTALRKKERAWFKNESTRIHDIRHPKVDPNAIQDMTADEILGYVLNLPEGYKQVFKLFVIDGFSHKEIGELLNIEASTSRAKLTHARKWMRETIMNANKLYAHES